MKKLLTVILVILSMNVSAQQQWVGTWAAAAEFTSESDMPQNSLAGHSLREIIRVSIGGNTISLHLSNEFSEEPLDIQSVYVANALDSSVIDKKSARYLTFSGKRKVTIPAHGIVASDALMFPLRPLQRLAITICYGSCVPIHATSHRGSRTTSYIAHGEISPNAFFYTKEKVEHWYNIVRLEVFSTAKAIAVLGNSITDGRGSTTNAQNRWTDFLATALHSDCSKERAVLNLGIGGNCVIEGGLSEPALQRFGRDILGQHGVNTLILFEGTNDIGMSVHSEQTAQQLIEAYQTLVSRARAAGVERVYGATITPFKGNSWYSLFHEAARQTVNEWIRTTEVFDGIIDFDKLVCNPDEPDCLMETYSDDWLHLNPKGYEIMGRYAAECLIGDEKNNHLAPLY